MVAAKPTTESRQALLQASLKIFADHGFEGTTVKHVADAAGVNVALVSYYFGGKEGLYKAALESVGFERLEVAERMLQPTNSADEFRLRLKLFAEEFLDCHLRNPHVMKIIHRDFDGTNPLALEVFREVFAQMFNKVRSFLEAGIKKQVLRKDLDADCCASMMFGGLVHSLRMDFLRQEVMGQSLKDPKYAAKFIDQFVQTFCEGTFRRSSP